MLVPRASPHLHRSGSDPGVKKTDTPAGRVDGILPGRKETQLPPDGARASRRDGDGLDRLRGYP